MDNLDLRTKKYKNYHKKKFSFPPTVNIGDYTVGKGHEPIVIAECGLAHMGSVKLAKQMALVAKDNGAHFFKTQHYGRGAEFVSSIALSQKDRLRKFRLNDKEIKDLAIYCENIGIGFLCTPHDKDALHCITGFTIPAIKVGSGELDNLSFLDKIASTGLPVIISTGLHTLDDVNISIKALKDGGCTHLIVMHCVTEYPNEYPNLNRIKSLKDVARGAPIGYSDHSWGNAACIVAAGMGACLIEKHFFIEDQPKLRDYAGACKTPHELRSLTQGVDAAYRAMRVTTLKEPVKWAYKCIHAVVDIPAGAIIKEDMVAIQRPGGGIPPWGLSQVVGVHAACEIKKYEAIQWEDVGIEGDRI